MAKRSSISQTQWQEYEFTRAFTSKIGTDPICKTSKYALKFFNTDLKAEQTVRLLTNGGNARFAVVPDPSANKKLRSPKRMQHMILLGSQKMVRDLGFQTGAVYDGAREKVNGINAWVFTKR